MSAFFQIPSSTNFVPYALPTDTVKSLITEPYAGDLNAHASEPSPLLVAPSPPPTIAWRDLLEMSAYRRCASVLLPVPFLGLLWLALWVLTQDTVIATLLELYRLQEVMGLELAWSVLVVIPCAYLTFAAGLRVAHEGFHGSLQLPAGMVRWLLHALSLLLVCSTHAIGHTHYYHHRDPLGADDVEGSWSRLPWYRAILGGWWFTARIQATGYRRANGSLRRAILTDIAFALLMVAAALISRHPVLLGHVTLMLLGHALTGFIAVWLVHYGEVATGRSTRHRWVSCITLKQWHHHEHHLHPAVPTCHLPVLATRLATLYQHDAHTYMTGAPPSSNTLCASADSPTKVAVYTQPPPIFSLFKRH